MKPLTPRMRTRFMRMEFAGEARALYRAAGGAPSSAPQRGAASAERQRSVAEARANHGGRVVLAVDLERVDPQRAAAAADCDQRFGSRARGVRAKGEHGCAGGRR